MPLKVGDVLVSRDGIKSLIILKRAEYPVSRNLSVAKWDTGYSILNEGKLMHIDDATVQYYLKHGTLNIYEA